MALGFVFVAGREERAREGKWSTGERSWSTRTLSTTASSAGLGGDEEDGARTDRAVPRSLQTTEVDDDQRNLKRTPCLFSVYHQKVLLT
jgi:hypothetical protein